MSTDPAVLHPQHYCQNGSIECIDAIRAALGARGFIAYCRGCVIKYHWRSPFKGNPKQDHEKAAWYSQKAAEAQEDADKEAVSDPERRALVAEAKLAEYEGQNRGSIDQWMDLEYSLKMANESIRIAHAELARVNRARARAVQNMTAKIQRQRAQLRTMHSLIERNKELEAEMGDIALVAHMQGADRANERVPKIVDDATSR